MERDVKTSRKIFKGAGILTGLLIGTLAGIIAVLLSGQMGIIGAVAAAVSIPSGLVLEKKFQGAEIERNAKSKGAYIALTLVGVGMFFICFFLLK